MLVTGSDKRSKLCNGKKETIPRGEKCIRQPKIITDDGGGGLIMMDLNRNEE